MAFQSSNYMISAIPETRRAHQIYVFTSDNERLNTNVQNSVETLKSEG